MLFLCSILMELLQVTSEQVSVERISIDSSINSTSTSSLKLLIFINWLFSWSIHIVPDSIIILTSILTLLKEDYFVMGHNIHLEVQISSDQELWLNLFNRKLLFLTITDLYLQLVRRKRLQGELICFGRLKYRWLTHSKYQMVSMKLNKLETTLWNNRFWDKQESLFLKDFVALFSFNQKCQV